MREFNTTGLCVPEMHYMVDVSSRVAQTRAMVERGDYFCVNRARQYGKTTLLAALERALAGSYEVAGLSFQKLGSADFSTEGMFVRGFSGILLEEVVNGRLSMPPAIEVRLEAFTEADPRLLTLSTLFRVISRWLRESERPVVLVIDEVDSATNNQVFLDLLAQLRQQYLDRGKNSSIPAFQSVVLAGVTDVKHLKAKIRPEEASKTNSPWNIAADFKVRMTFDGADVAGMLEEYERDHATGMDVDAVTREIVDWTGGYPFLVSRVCQLIDEDGLPWTREGVNRAVRRLLEDDDVSLFDSLTGKLEDHPTLKEQLRALLMRGEEVFFSPYNETQKLLMMYGFVASRGGRVAIANRVFEMLLYDYYLVEEQGRAMKDAGALGKSRFVRDHFPTAGSWS